MKDTTERHMFEDPRVFNAIMEAKKNDNSFKEKGFWGVNPRYSQSECREFWFQAMAIGMQEGLEMGSLKGQRIDLFNNCKQPRQKEFLEKFYELAGEYNCAIVYHPREGMCVMDLNR